MPSSRLRRTHQRRSIVLRVPYCFFASVPNLMSMFMRSETLCPLLKKVFSEDLKCESPKVIYVYLNDYRSLAYTYIGHVHTYANSLRAFLYVFSITILPTPPLLGWLRHLYQTNALFLFRLRLPRACCITTISDLYRYGL